MDTEKVMANVIALFHENEIPMNDRNGVLYDAIEDGVKALVAIAKNETAAEWADVCRDYVHGEELAFFEQSAKLFRSRVLRIKGDGNVAR